MHHGAGEAPVLARRPWRDESRRGDDKQNLFPCVSFSPAGSHQQLPFSAISFPVFDPFQRLKTAWHEAWVLTKSIQSSDTLPAGSRYHLFFPFLFFFYHP